MKLYAQVGIFSKIIYIWKGWLFLEEVDFNVYIEF